MTKLQKSASISKKAVAILFVLFSIITLWHIFIITISILKQFTNLSDGMIDLGFYQFYFSNGGENIIFPLTVVLFLRILQFLVVFCGFKLLNKILNEQIAGEYFSVKVINCFQNIGLIMIGYNGLAPLISKLLQYFYNTAAYTNGYWIINNTSIAVEWNPFPIGVSWMLFGLMIFAVSTFFKRGAILQLEDDGMI